MPQLTPTIVFLSTYPPRECGIATFTQDLLLFSQKLLGSKTTCKVAAMNLTPLDTYKYPPEVAWKIDQNSKKDFIHLANTVNTDDNIKGVILQHEYGIFGGIQGENILSFMTRCHKPVLVTLHTMLPEPGRKMMEVTGAIIRQANSVVVLTQKSKSIVESLYPDVIGKVAIIPHGIHPSTFSSQERFKKKLGLEGRTVLSTFGLLSRGKGIEYAIRALPSVIKKYPDVVYLILGETHPVIRRHEGERYRQELFEIVTRMKLKNHVKFYDQYLSLSDLLEFLKATDIYIATSTNPNQAVSGTLSYALGSGRAVISTEFSQAKEIVTHDIGRLVPIKESPALTEALLDLLSNPERLKQMHRTAYAKTRDMLWSNVAHQYLKLLIGVVVPEINLKHLNKMTDDFGLFQFAKYDKPDKQFGYTLDDNARALITCCWLLKKNTSPLIKKRLSTYFTFVESCHRADGSFVNYIDFEKKQPTKQNQIENLEEARSRALWALAEVIASDHTSHTMKDRATVMFKQILDTQPEPVFLRSRAFIIKALSLVLAYIPMHKTHYTEKITIHANALSSALKKNSHKSWRWFEPHLTYNNALLAESLIIAGNILHKTKYTHDGIESIQFLIDKTFSSNFYRPIGQSHWYSNSKKRSIFDQQPEDPASMILALVYAYHTTHHEKYKNLALTCFNWFLGNNTINKSLYDAHSGGCYDGLESRDVNKNQGAESLISYLMSSIKAAELQQL